MMSGALMLLALTLASAAPAPYYDSPSEMEIPHKRAALVLDRILIALQKALQEPHEEALDGPRAVPLLGPNLEHNDMEMVIPQKRAALVLDRILIALQKALHEPREEALDGPRAVPLRGAYLEHNDMSALQRRGQAGAAGRGRVLRCYFNAVTCF